LAIAAALKGVRDQLRVTIFLTYTEQYSKVMNEVSVVKLFGPTDRREFRPRRGGRAV
jgi:hypothetical protein